MTANAEHLLVYHLPHGGVIRVSVQINSVVGDVLNYTWKRVGDVDPRIGADADLVARYVLPQIEQDVVKIATALGHLPPAAGISPQPS